MFSKRPLVVPLVFTFSLVAVALFTPVHKSPAAMWGTIGAAGVLALWNVLLAATLRPGRKLTLEIVLRKQHYLQACGQGLLLLYWGWYWPDVYAQIPFIL